jgi:hypothetical protein
MARVEEVKRDSAEGDGWKGSTKAAQTFKKQSACCNDLPFALLFILNLACLGWLGLWTFTEGGGVEGHVNRTGALFRNVGNGSEVVDVTLFGHNVGEMELFERFTQWLVDESANVKRDVQHNFDLMAMAAVIGICVGITWLQLLKRLTSMMVHLTMMLVVVTVTAVGFLFFHYSEGCLVQVNKLLSSEEMGCVELSRSLTETESDILKVLAYGVWVIAAVIFIAIFVLRTKVALTVTIFEEACASCLTNMGIYPVTVFVIALVLAFHVFWASTAVYLFSVPGDTNVGEDIPLAFMQSPDVPVRMVLFYFVFSYFWVCAFLRALFHASVAGIVGNWYFNRHRASVGSPHRLAWLARDGRVCGGDLLVPALRAQEVRAVEQEPPGHRHGCQVLQVLHVVRGEVREVREPVRVRVRGDGAVHVLRGREEVVQAHLGVPGAAGGDEVDQRLRAHVRQALPDVPHAAALRDEPGGHGPRVLRSLRLPRRPRALPGLQDPGGRDPGRGRHGLRVLRA